VLAAPNSVTKSQCQVRFTPCEGKGSAADTANDHVLRELLALSSDDGLIFEKYMRVNLPHINAFLKTCERLVGFDLLTTWLSLTPVLAHAAPTLRCGVTKSSVSRALILSTVFVAASGQRKATLRALADRLKSLTATVLAKGGVGGGVVCPPGTPAQVQAAAGNEGDAVGRQWSGICLSMDEFPPTHMLLNFSGNPNEANAFNRNYNMIVNGCDIGGDAFLATVSTSKPSADLCGVSFIGQSQPKALLSWTRLLDKGDFQQRVRVRALFSARLCVALCVALCVR